MDEEQLTLTEKFETYAKKLYHYLKTEQDITFEKHVENPEMVGMSFHCEREIGKQDIFHYTYIDEKDNVIINKRRV